MDAGSPIIRVTQGSEAQVNSARESGATSAAPRTVAPVAQQPAFADAVAVTVSTLGRPVVAPAKEESVEEAKPVSVDEAEQIVERVVAELSKTSVKFNTALGGDDGELNFQVVDKTSGKVVREFPSEGLPEALKQANEEGGITFDGTA